MICYRIGRRKFSKDLTGEGARLYGGRWNNILTACIYTSESRALALLEYSVNVSVDDIPTSLCITAFDISDKYIHEISIADLPGNWRESPAPASTKDFGTNLLVTMKVPAIKIPSAIISQEFNVILNPKHVAINEVSIIDIVDFSYDLRIKAK